MNRKRAELQATTFRNSPAEAALLLPSKTPALPAWAARDKSTAKRKFALDFCLLCPDLFEIPESLVEAAIDIEEQLFTSATPDPDSPPRRSAPAGDLTQKSAAQCGRERLLKKIAEKQPVSLRDLQQSFHRWKQVGLNVNLEQLFAEGIVQWNADQELVLGQAPGLATSNGSMD